MWVRAADFVVRALSIAAALFSAPPTQPQAAAPKGASRDEPSTPFADLLDAATNTTESTAQIAGFATAPVAPQDAMPVTVMPTQLTPAAGAIDGGASNVAAETPPGPAVAAQTVTNAAVAAVIPTPITEGADIAASTLPAPTAAALQTTAVQQSAAVTPAIASAAVQTTTASNGTGADDGEDASDSEIGAATNAAATPASVTTASTLIATSASGAASTPQNAGAMSGNATASTSLSSQEPAALATPADAQPAESPKADVKQQAQSGTGPAQPAAQAQTNTQAAPAVDPAVQAADIKQPASATHTTNPDALTAPTSAGDATRAHATPPALQSAPAATIQVYTRMIERADGRAQRFEVRLDPAELGRVDVRIEIGADRKVHAVLAVHDSAALTDLMKGQRALERALADAGIDLADKGVRFELAADNGRNGAANRDGDGARGSSPNVWRNFDVASVDVSDAAVSPPPAWRTQRLDLVA